MAKVPSDLRFAKSHEWVRVEGDIATVGISDHAQEELTELVFIELPVAGKRLALEDTCAVVESVKTASDIYAPVSGEVVEVNTGLEDDPGAVNRDPYGEGWLFKIRLEDPADLGDLLSPEDYLNQITV